MKQQKKAEPKAPQKKAPKKATDVAAPIADLGKIDEVLQEFDEPEEEESGCGCW